MDISTLIFNNSSSIDVKIEKPLEPSLSAPQQVCSGRLLQTLGSCLSSRSWARSHERQSLGVTGLHNPAPEHTPNNNTLPDRIRAASFISFI